MLQIRKIVLTILANIAFTVVLFLVVEGFSSVVIFTKQTFFTSLLEERKHTQYDDEIGWINLPDLHIENMYGPGKSFSTNSRAFRSNKELSSSIPEDKIRIVCSGDSFTLGYGVDTADGWCQQLEAIDKHIEPVNLGQGGYGNDQAYLWYARNSPTLNHDIQLFAFITDDFLRMEGDSFFGYGKPVLKVENGMLVNKNRPVPKLAFTIPRLPMIREGISHLSVVQLLRRVLRPVTGEPQGSQTDQTQKELETREVSLKIFEDLQRLNQAKGSVLVLIYLPRRPDYPLGKEVGPWRQFFHDLSSEHRFVTIDLVDEIAKIPPQDTPSLYSSVNGHYSEKGNRIVAEALYRQLLAQPEIKSKLQPNRP